MPDKVLNIFGSMVTLGLVTTLVTNAGGTAEVVRAIGQLFGNTLGIAMGRASKF